MSMGWRRLNIGSRSWGGSSAVICKSAIISSGVQVTLVDAPDIFSSLLRQLISADSRPTRIWGRTKGNENAALLVKGPGRGWSGVGDRGIPSTRAIITIMIIGVYYCLMSRFTASRSRDEISQAYLLSETKSPVQSYHSLPAILLQGSLMTLNGALFGRCPSRHQRRLIPCVGERRRMCPPWVVPPSKTKAGM